MKLLTYKDLIHTIKKESIPVDQERLKQVYHFAEEAHADQKRYSGEPFFQHPLHVANIIASWGMDQTTIETALLHDVVEDTSFTVKDLEKKFGKQVAFLVNGVTNAGKVKLRNSINQEFTENLRKMFVAMSRDIRVVLVRLADRYHNMLTLRAVPKSKQRRIAFETIEIYAPLAERLGMGEMKGELEDLSFMYIHPKEYRQVSRLAEEHFTKAKKTTDRVILEISKLLKKNHIFAQVGGRPKKKYSLYCKLKRSNINGDIGKVNDLIAVRIITNNKLDCYKALGLVHQYFKPVPHMGISDFIAQPKPNGYQSIHTKIFNKEGQIIEVQIRTQDMHEQAEFGAAHHSFYSEAKAKGASEEALEKGTAFKITQKMNWVQQLAEWQKQTQSSEEFVTDLKLDALSHRIYVFSPLGDVYDLPVQATPVDFAFAVHSDIGFHLQGVKVNQKMASLDYPLQSGDIVEIIKSKRKRRPSRDWLTFVKSNKAKAEIKKALNL